ncbi:hypothetical protein EXIGLDRAFT_731326 [Exidia glandulosa HHB12029]|uniref:Uncharacterized protein n=1 Tax=Exidia glandulosa HHB12029 TaxID=1314781 RepID=A0A165BXJ0_EXIGL|nr:hypothetical protein EXIGLDRAFT_731326 [Exidia glandulosa HHB12029]
MSTLALAFLLPLDDAESKELRVWRWVREQQGLSVEEEDVAPDVEDESTRIRSSFSDASTEVPQLELDDEDALCDMTMDDLVQEIDTWLGASASPTDAYMQDRKDGRRNHGAIMMTATREAHAPPPAATPALDARSLRAQFLARRPTFIGEILHSSMPSHTFSLRSATSDQSLRSTTSSFALSLDKKPTPAPATPTRTHIIGRSTLTNMDSISSLLRARQNPAPPLSRKTSLLNISAPITLATSSDSLSTGTSSHVRSRSSEETSDAESVGVLTPNTSLTNIHAPVPRVVSPNGHLRLERALPPLPPLSSSPYSRSSIKPPIPSAPVPSSYVHRAVTSNQSQTRRVRPGTISKRDISAPQPASFRHHGQQERERVDSGATAFYSPNRPAPSPLSARAPSPPPTPESTTVFKQNPYALAEVKRGRRMSDRLGELTRSLSRSSSPTRVFTPSGKREKGAPPPSSFNALGSLASARESTSSLVGATGRGVRRMLSFSRERSFRPASPPPPPQDSDSDSDSDSDDDADLDDFELLEAPRDAAYRGALAFGSSMVSNTVRTSPASSRSSSRLSSLIPHALSSRPSSPTQPARTALLVKAPPSVTSFEAVRRWASQHGPVSRVHDAGKKGIRVVWRDLAAAGRVCPGGGCTVLVDGVGMVRVEVVRA